MAKTKITALTELTDTNIAIGDLIPIVDISDTSQAASGTTKKVTITSLATAVASAFSGDSPTFVNLNTTGTTTLGDASGDAVTINAATITLANDTNFVLSGGVNGVSFDTDVLSIDATNDRVGIGTVSPQATLHIGAGTDAPLVTVGTLIYASNAGTAGIIARDSTNDVEAGIRAASSGGIIGTHTNHDLFIRTNDATRMTILSGGNVGIGVTPSAWTSRTAFQVVGGAIAYESGISNGNSTIFSNNFYYGSGDKAIATGYSQGIVMNPNGVGDIKILTTSGTTSANGTISFTAGPYVSAGGTSWTSSSDERLKNITGEIQNGLTKVLSLRCAEFTWKDDLENKKCVGLIAQDIEKVLPEVISKTVKYNSDDTTEYLGIAYDQVIPLLVSAIKELNQKIENK